MRREIGIRRGNRRRREEEDRRDGAGIYRRYQIRFRRLQVHYIGKIPGQGDKTVKCEVIQILSTHHTNKLCRIFWCLSNVVLSGIM